jgi:hypothetical protein
MKWVDAVQTEYNPEGLPAGQAGVEFANVYQL